MAPIAHVKQGTRHVCVNDPGQFRRAARPTAMVTKPTTLTELNGIRIAAIRGVKCPLDRMCSNSKGTGSPNGCSP